MGYKVNYIHAINFINFINFTHYKTNEIKKVRQNPETCFHSCISFILSQNACHALILDHL